MPRTTDCAIQNYGQERGYQQDAIGQAQNLMGGATGLLNNAAELPWVGVRAQNGGVSGLTSGYGTQTTKATPIACSIARTARALARLPRPLRCSPTSA
jgi:hypothetical protein